MTIIKTALLVLLAASLPAAVLTDGSFETGVGWTDTDTFFGSSRCDLPTCTNGLGTTGPRTGNFWIWFGGAVEAQTAVLEQTGVTIPVGTPAIQFYVWAGQTPMPFSFTFYVDGFSLFSFNQASAGAYSSGYTLVALDPGIFADGGDHTLRFEYSDGGGVNTTNINLDDVSLAPVVVPEPQAVALALSGLAVIGWRRRRRGVRGD